MKNLSNVPSPLDRISIASPCAADWSQMQGNERRRFCSSCKLHVHDLSRMTTAEGMALLQQAGKGRVCVRLFRRADGTVLTRDCPVGLRQKLRRMAARAGALWLLLCTGLVACVRPSQGAGTGTLPAQQPVRLQGEAVMGDVLAPGDRPPQPPAPVEMGRVKSGGR